ncbi:MAG TPA: hypothetical protein VF017_24115 [Thermoanaerobaculia bacterium]|nr:hypothetical protein [Thermoanaerobaculia bacterium]
MLRDLGRVLGMALLLAGTGWAQEDPAIRAEAQGDAAWARRAEGFETTGEVSPGPVGEAVAAYQQALAAEPGRVDLQLRLIEALYFQGHFATADPGERRRLHDRQLELALAAVAVTDPQGRCSAEVLQGGCSLAAAAHFWAAVSWGVYALEHGMLAAAAKDAAGEMRRHAERTAALDPSYADGGGFRLLGRLHTTAPRVPLFSGWINPREGIARLRIACALSRRDPRNPLFLAEALLRHQPERRAEALALLREVAARTPDPAQAVEQSEMLALARQSLAEAERVGDRETPSP